MDILRSYINCIPDVVFLVKYEIKPSVLRDIKNSLENQDKYYDINDAIVLGKPDLIIRRLIDHHLTKMEHLHKFKLLENEIIHFKHITVSKDEAKDIKDIIERVKKHGKSKSYEEKIEKG